MVCDTSVFSRTTQHAMTQLSEDEISFELIEVTCLSSPPNPFYQLHHCFRQYCSTFEHTVFLELCSFFYLDGM